MLADLPVRRHSSNLVPRRGDSLDVMQTAYIGMGANLPSRMGPPEATLAAAASHLESLGRVVARSSLYSTQPVGFADQPRFLNAVVVLETGLDPHALLEGLLRIEHEFGRDRSAGIRNGPRTLDLDILVFGDLAVSEPGLELPHPRMLERGFVMIPLAELASKYKMAKRLQTINQLLQKFIERPPGTSDVVVSVQSTLWSAHSFRDAGDSGGT
jgi:2-amino-4-hydroxy-6-hydroxymethyldihydropteridine diphosphokinase